MEPNWIYLYLDIGDKNSYKIPQGDTDMDYETVFHQKEDFDNSDDDYVNLDEAEQWRDVTNDYEGEDIYANRAE